MPLKVKITHWHGVAIWKWRVKEEDCGICRQPFDATCPKCKMPGDECPPVWGQCNHHFHMHCIMKWLQQQRAQDKCPLCRQQWEIKLEQIDNNPQPQPQLNQQQQPLPILQPNNPQQARRRLQLD